jgi:hypothetical protein
MAESATQIEDYLRHLPEIASYLLAQKRSEQAVVKYEMFSDSLIWSDERLSVPELNTDCLRFLFRYRTSLILGKPDERYADFWREGKRHFAGWIGFAPERTSPNSELVNLYIKEKKRLLDQLEDE